MTGAARNEFSHRLAVDVFLPDGSHVIVARSNELASDPELDDELVEVLLEAGDGENDVLGHLQACAEARGLTFRASLDRDPTTVFLSAVDRSPRHPTIAAEVRVRTEGRDRDAPRAGRNTETRTW
jgi:hypothetical protein